MTNRKRIICKKYNLIGEFGKVPDVLFNKLPKDFHKFCDEYYHNGYDCSFYDDIYFHDPGKIVIAWYKSKIIGVCAFRTNGITHQSFITWVDKNHRKSGVAYKLWARALKREHRKSLRITVNAGSESGEKLIMKLMDKYPQHKWNTNLED